LTGKRLGDLVGAFSLAVSDDPTRKKLELDNAGPGSNQGSDPLCRQKVWSQMRRAEASQRA